MSDGFAGSVSALSADSSTESARFTEGVKEVAGNCPTVGLTHCSAFANVENANRVIVDDNISLVQRDGKIKFNAVFEWSVD